VFYGKQSSQFRDFKAGDRSEYKSLVFLLEKTGVDINAQDCNGQTALFRALIAETVSLLAKHGANLNIQDNRGRTAATNTCYYDVIKRMIKLGLDPKIQDDNHNTFFHHYCNIMNKSFKPRCDKFADGMVLIALENGLDPNTKNKVGISVFHLILINGLENSMVEAMQEYKIDMSYRFNGKNYIELASYDELRQRFCRLIAYEVVSNSL